MQRRLASGGPTDWFVVETDGQLIGTCVEGSAAHWRNVILAIRKRCNHDERRCAVAFDKNGTCRFWSPRNSMDGPEFTMTTEEADEFAAEALTLVGLHDNESDELSPGG